MPMVSTLDKFGWHEWLCKSHFSFLVGASSPEELIARAIDLGYQSLCLNDFDGAYGLARGFRALKKQKSRRDCGAFKLHYGAEIHLEKDHEMPILLQNTLVLVAQSWEGYRNLCRILSYSHRDGKTAACIPLGELLSFASKGLIAIQPMRGSLRKGFEPSYFGPIKEHFSGNLYFAISRHLHPTEDALIGPTLKLASYLAAPCLLSQDAFFHIAQRKPLNDLLHAVRHNLALEQATKHFFPNCERYLQRPLALKARFFDLPIYERALRDAYDLAASCGFDFSELRYHYPREMIPPPHTAQSYLEELSWQGAKARYGWPLAGKIGETLDRELAMIEDLGFADYFLTVWDIVRWARSQGILCQGRGSAANSAVCFVLGITAVDPGIFDLLFERFMSRERGDPPDIDVDFEHERREEVIQYIYSRYGRDKAAMVANVITFRKRGALRAVGKALGVEAKVLDLVAKATASRYTRGQELDSLLSGVRHELEREGKGVQAAEIPWLLWGQMAALLRGRPRHLGIHSGGFMISAMPLDYLVPQEPATKPGRFVVQWCKDDIEGLGFFKIDILSLGMLTALRKAFGYIEAVYGQRLSLDTIPQDDAATYAMIQKADTVGTFQIESRAQMSMLPRLRPRCFYDLVIEVAIIRPGPIQGGVIHPYLKRREGKEAITFPDPRLRPILERTLGIAIFQEQAMRIAITVGNFTPGEADELRKSIGAWNIRGDDLNPWLEKLAAGMRANGFNDAFIQQILGQMHGFSDYGFPESHAVSFALLAYSSSYLKYHYPDAFFVAILNSQPMGFYSPHSLLQAAKQAGVSVLPLCANHSHWDHCLEATSCARGQDFAIRLGFRLVNGLSRRGGESLLSARKDRGGHFATFSELLQTAGLYRGDVTALAAANAFQSFGLSRLEAIWQAEAVPFAPFLEEQEEAIAWPQEDALATMERDFAAQNTSLGPHPAVLIKTSYWDYKLSKTQLTRATEIKALTSGLMVNVFGMILVKQAPPSAKGMVFFTLEDETGFLNLVFSPQNYQRFHRLIEKESFLCIRGRVQKANESHSLLVIQVWEKLKPQAAIVSLFPDENEQAKSEARPGKKPKLIKPRSYI